jgi:hypothetical protein
MYVWRIEDLRTRQFSLSLVRFSSSDACERVIKCIMNVQIRVYRHTQNIRNSSTRSHPSEGEKRTRNRSKNCKCININGP